MKTRQYLRGHVLRAEGGGDGKPLRVVAATAGKKKDGLNLTMDGADLARFEANPVVGYGHSYWGRDGLPIGRSDKTWIDGDRLLMDISFDPEDEFAAKVEKKYRGGWMSAFSIGFDFWNVDDAGVPEGWELYEVSAVPLPMDPNAVVEEGRGGELALIRALAGFDAGRAGAVLSKKNKALVQSAADALTALLAAADKDDDDTDDGRGYTPDQARLLRLAGI